MMATPCDRPQGLSKSLKGKIMRLHSTLFVLLLACSPEEMASVAERFGQEVEITVLTLTFDPAEALRA